MFLQRKFSNFMAVVALASVALVSVASGATKGDAQRQAPGKAPIKMAILIQDDLISQVSNELKVTAEFIRSLPPGSEVMVGYITSGSLQVRQPFTTDLNRAAQSLRIPISSTSASSYNPYIEVIEALHRFDSNGTGRNVILLVSDGLDVSRGFDSTSAGHTVDLERAIREANSRNVSIYSFYAPAVGLSSRSRLAASYGQSSLNRISAETGGRAFFQGISGFVTFDPYFKQLRQALNQVY
jgi:hypothetical protein